MGLLIKQVSSALLLMFGLIISLSWFYWKDSDSWLIIIGSFLVIIGIIGFVFAIREAAEELES